MFSAFAIDRKMDLESIDQKVVQEIIDLAGEIQELIKEEDILLFYGTKFDARPDASDIKKDMEKNRNILIEALAKKGIAQCAQGNTDEATETLFKLLKFTDITDSKVIFFVHPIIKRWQNKKEQNICQNAPIFFFTVAFKTDVFS